jgi:hypothetical protein
MIPQTACDAWRISLRDVRACRIEQRWHEVGARIRGQRLERLQRAFHGESRRTRPLAARPESIGAWRICAAGSPVSLRLSRTGFDNPEGCRRGVVHGCGLLL